VAHQREIPPTEAWHDAKTWHDQHKESMTFGQRLSDAIASGMGSWRFIIIQSAIVAAWIGLNLVEVLFKPFDPYPFILLNLLFSTQAAYAAPIIMMSQNRSAQTSTARRRSRSSRNTCRPSRSTSWTRSSLL